MRWLVAGGVLLAGTLAVLFILLRMNGEDRKQHDFAFPDLQDATTPERAGEILRRWNGRGADDDIRSTMRVDLVFPLFYAGLLAVICLRAAAHVRSRWVAVAGMIAAAAVIAGGIGDILENLKMLEMVGHPDRAGEILTVMKYKAVKEGGIVAALVYALLAHFNAR